jgi:AAA domain
MPMFSNLQIASVLGGRVHGDGALAPAPGRGPDDLSLWIFPNKDRTDYVVEPQRGDDPTACRNYIDERMAQAARKSAGRSVAGDDNVVEIHAARKARELGPPVDFSNANPVADASDINSAKTDPPAADWIDEAPTDARCANVPPLVPCIADINAHLYELFPPAFVHRYPEAGIEIAWGHPLYKDGAVNQAKIFSAFDLAGAADFAFKKNIEGNNIYVGPALRIGSHKSGRAGDKDVITAAFAWVEYDKAGDAHRVQMLCKKDTLRPLRPAIVVTTGTVPNQRDHLYFAIDYEATPPTSPQLAAMNTGLMKVLGTDSVFNASRVMRLGGTVNNPKSDKIAIGYVPELTTLRIFPEGLLYNIATLSGLGTDHGDKSEEAPNPFTQAGEQAGDYKAGRSDDDIIALLELTRTATNWHNAMRGAIATMLGYDWSDLQIKLACAPYCKNGVDDNDLDPMIDKARIKWNKPDPRQQQQQANQKGPRAPIVATPFVWIDAKKIPMRDWLYGRLLLRQFLSMTIAPGAVGKSSLIVAETLAMITARDLLGVKPDQALKVWLWNLEDPEIETTRKIQAACIEYEITRDEIEGNLFVNSGRDQPLVVAQTTRHGTTICQPIIDDLVKQIKERGIDVLVIDPFVSCHEVEENDNSAIDRVAKQWSRVAELGNAAVHLIHHTRKAPAGTEVTTESGRGAKALTDAARIVRALNVMTKEEGVTAGVDNSRFYFRAFNDKANLAPPMECSDWFRLASVPLGNGPFGGDGDDMGVVVKWTWPDPLAGVTGRDFDKVAAVIRAAKWRKDPQAAQWVGHAIARALGLSIGDKRDKAKAKSLVDYWLGTGALVEVHADDEKRNKRTFVEVKTEE